VDLQLRVGLNTGEVAVGEMGKDQKVEYVAVGDAVNLAARMESEAPPGGILITENTYQLVNRLFEFDPTGQIQIKGREEPVKAFLVTGTVEEPTSIRGIEGLHSAMVGRDREIDQLTEILEDIQQGQGRIVTIMGEAGIGKTRLIQEIKGAFLSEEMRWMEGRALSYGQSLSLWIFQDLIRGHLGINEGDSQSIKLIKLKSQIRALYGERQAEITPYLVSLLSIHLEGEYKDRLSDLHPEALKRRIFVLVSRLIQRLSEEKPVVLVLEDLHWADPTSIVLLKELFPTIEKNPILLCIAARPYKDQPWWDAKVVAQTEFSEIYTEILLEPLKQEDSSSLVENLLEIEDLPQEVKQSILDLPKGNPFFLEEVLRALIDQGVLIKQNARWQASSETLSLQIPDTVQGVIRARIDMLEEDQKSLLQMASVIGKTFLRSVLERVSSMEWVLGTHLRSLQRAELILEKGRHPEPEYSFKHDLTQEVAYNSLLEDRRRLIHRRVAESIESLYQERLEEFCGMLGYHWSESGDSEKAIKYLQEAGDKARLAYEPNEAVAHYTRALQHLRDEDDPENVAKTLMKLGLTYQIAGDYKKLSKCYMEAAQLWEPKPSLYEKPGGISFRELSGQMYSFDPAYAQWVTEAPVVDSLFEGLGRMDPENNVLPGIAKSWDISEDGKRYLFHLRENTYWSDGDPVTAHDFEYAWKRILKPETESPHASALYSILGARAFHRGEVTDPDLVGVHALDDWTLEVLLEDPSVTFLNLIASRVALPQPRKWIEKHGNAWADPDKIVSNGPFLLSKYEPDQIVVLDRNPMYRGPFPGNLDHLEFIITSEADQNLSAFTKRRLDATWLRRDQVEEAKNIHPDELTFIRGIGNRYLTFVVTRPPLDDVRVRRALVQMIDRGEIAKTIHQPSTSIGGLIPMEIAGHSPGLAPEYDPQHAERLLREVSFQRTEPLKLFVIDGLQGGIELMVARWREILDLQVEVLVFEDQGEFLISLEYDPPHMFILGVGGILDAADYLYNFHSEMDYPTRWKSSRLDQILEQARMTSNLPQRMDLCQQADKLIVKEEVFATPLNYGGAYWLIKPWVKGLERFGKDYRQIVVEPHD